MNTDFRTPLSIPKSKFELEHKNALLLIGSCFSENMEKKLKTLKFDCLSNPLGISYNPISIHNLLQLDKDIKIEENEGIYYSYQLHSELNQLNKNDFELNFKRQLELQKKQLAKKGTLIITYGTAWVYELKHNKAIVNNCQKTPSSNFKKRLLSVEEIISSWEGTANYLNHTFPQRNVIFTLSPVRHLKDGIHENQLSKAILQLAIDKICSQNKNYSYFPSYEIMMDDLRDYRFYKADLIHPNEIAIDYIWEQFTRSNCSEETLKTIQEITKLNTSIQHKPFQPESQQHQKFLQKLLLQLKQFQEQNNIDFSLEISNVQAQIK